VPVAGAGETAWSRRAAGLERVVEAGILGGVVAGIAMGLFTMLASATWLGDGLFTPAYRVAFLVETTVLDTALREAAAGDRFYLSREALSFGVALHCFVAGGLGAVFALAARALRPRGRRALAIAGAAYGLVVAGLTGLVVLPAIARLLDLGAPIAALAGAVGWPSYLAAHAVYGLALVLWPPLRAAVAGPEGGRATREGCS
jgi:hypothetical protein